MVHAALLIFKSQSSELLIWKKCKIDLVFQRTGCKFRILVVFHAENVCESRVYLQIYKCLEKPLRGRNVCTDSAAHCLFQAILGCFDHIGISDSD